MGKNPMFSYTGILHPAYKNGSGKGRNYYKTRKFLALYNNMCSRCGATQKLDVHHKNNDPSDNRKNNIQVLCKSCHSRLHWYPRKIKIRKDKRKIVINKLLYRKQAIEHKIYKEHYFTAKDLENFTGYSRERIRQLRNDGRYTFIKIYNRYLYAHLIPKLAKKISLYQKLYGFTQKELAKKLNLRLDEIATLHKTNKLIIKK